MIVSSNGHVSNSNRNNNEYYIRDIATITSNNTIIPTPTPVSASSGPTFNESPMDIQFQKIIAIILQSKLSQTGSSYSHEFLDQLTELSIRFMNECISKLGEYCRIQRRHKPTLSDVRLLMNTKGISPTMIYDEIISSKQITKDYGPALKLVSNQIAQLQNPGEEQEEEIDEQSLPFFINEHYEITNLVPRLNQKGRYIPHYLPDFPPDYTYQSTPKYMETINDLKELRLKLVDESRMIEKSLHDLTENEEIEWHKKFEEELQEFEGIKGVELEEEEDEHVDEKADEKKVETKEEEKKEEKKEVDASVEDKAADSGVASHVPLDGQQIDGTATTLPAPTPIAAQTVETVAPIEEQPFSTPIESKSFDFITYAQKRKQIEENHKQLQLKKQKLRENNIFIKTELYYSPYSTLKPTMETEQYFKDILSHEFKQVVSSIRKAEKKKQEKMEKLLQEKLRREREQRELQKANEIQFNFNNFNASSSSSSSDEFSDDDEGDKPGHHQFPDLSFNDGNDDISEGDSSRPPSSSIVVLENEGRVEVEGHRQKQVHFEDSEEDDFEEAEVEEVKRGDQLDSSSSQSDEIKNQADRDDNKNQLDGNDNMEEEEDDDDVDDIEQSILRELSDLSSDNDEEDDDMEDVV
ncbi:uncharacterized protein J8A68_001644 [[Candida] subhashii]|uniref:Transcription initiation factor TFIID subunit 8 n=1 Tax=[Candida] subhashii TaxID=561895 RepID=A0A8J5QKM4_9ASCO|nr:uncharacterized protein J8A68_001644 [[Candida] subhashii]KAG7664827.1 hypothetical protein J8A68_001644 [[Candida] subhashii]